MHRIINQYCVIEARFRNGKSFNNVAKEFGISTNTIGVHIKKILDKLKIPECLEKLAGGPVFYTEVQDHPSRECTKCLFIYLL